MEKVFWNIKKLDTPEDNMIAANILTASFMRIIFLLFTIIEILDLINVFIIDKQLMTITYIISAIGLWIPTILIRTGHEKCKKLPVIGVTTAALFLLLVNVTLSYHIIIIYIFPIAIASLYFSKKLNIYATGITAATIILGQIGAFYMSPYPDLNFPTLSELLLFSILPKVITFISIGSIFVMLTNRTSFLLNNLLDAIHGLARYQQEMVMSFSTLVEKRDDNTGGHIHRTSLYVELIAKELKKRDLFSATLTDDYMHDLTMAAPMHDIGKISVPDAILTKPGKLTDEEFAIMKTHAASGGRIIRETFGQIGDVEYEDMAFDVATYHHEKWNGKGYPSGLSESDIPLSARIMAIADVFDAVSEKRCYRDALPLEECFRIIEQGRGTDFDPVITDVFLSIRDQVTAIHSSKAAEKTREHD